MQFFFLAEKSMPSDPSLKDKWNELQVMINNLDSCRKVNLTLGSRENQSCLAKTFLGPFTQKWIYNYLKNAYVITSLKWASLKPLQSCLTCCSLSSDLSRSSLICKQSFFQDVLAQIQAVLGRSDTLRDLLLLELSMWQDRQRRACIGDVCDTSLRQLEKW